jgi:hypothetical protein
MIGKRGTITALSVAAVVTGLLFGSAPATADPGDGAVQETFVEQGMAITGFDEKVAAANGYTLVTYANGDRQTVPVDEGSVRPRSALLKASRDGRFMASSAVSEQRLSAGNTDFNEVWGNCGKSWIRLSKTKRWTVGVVSGFSNLPFGAVTWSWDVQLADSVGVRHETFGAALPLPDRAAHGWFNIRQVNFSYAFVYSGVAILANGFVCTPGHPDVTVKT